ncbi:hypothetical protein V0288_00970 [Pannus brasiliensis CCIBt3594]|uniref:Uncharacterized protein n=1 Tax=Pannus brasiliensis CCIBt3594 TaxID=1427578 RepID=A0AAW9QD41_9CHRO
MKLAKKERKQLIGKISQASGIAQYALEEKLTDEQVSEAVQHLEVLRIVKSANNYNRYCQGQKTAEANAKLKKLIELENSEILKMGQWLFNNLAKKGQERKQGLLEKGLLHKEDYNLSVTDLKDTIQELNQKMRDQTKLAKTRIAELEDIIDSRKKQLEFLKNYIINNYGYKTWNNILKTMPEDPQEDTGT